MYPVDGRHANVKECKIVVGISRTIFRTAKVSRTSDFCKMILARQIRGEARSVCKYPHSD